MVSVREIEGLVYTAAALELSMLLCSHLPLQPLPLPPPLLLPLPLPLPLPLLLLLLRSAL